MIIFTLYLSSVSFWSLIFPWPLGFFDPARIQKIYTKKHTHLDVTNCVLFSSLCADQEENEIFLLCPGVSTSKPWRTWRWKMTTAKTYPLFNCYEESWQIMEYCPFCTSCAMTFQILPFCSVKPSFTPLYTFRIYSSGSHGPVLMLLHGGGHSALSWAVFTVSFVHLTKPYHTT